MLYPILMSKRILDTIDIATGYPVYRIKAFYLDRLRAEGIDRAAVYIDDATAVITIEPMPADKEAK